MRNKLLYCFFLLTLLGSLVQAETLNQLLPVDEAERDLSFVQFRQQLMEIVKRRDPESFTQFVSATIYSGPDKKKGMSNFVKHWQPQNSDSELWPTMESILKLGGGFLRSEKGVKFCAPYVFTNFPDNLDIYGHSVIIKDNVPLKSAPLSSSQSVTTLSYALLKVEDWRSIKETNKNVSWIKVTTMDGKKGYVDKQMLRSPTDYSACFLFTPRSGWKLVSLVSNE